tara:strand:- start:575 stop:796 length:222 start_codon:yes stop_codon:yes gene_type:complete
MSFFFSVIYLWEAFTTLIFKVLDPCSTYILKLKKLFIAIKVLKLKYEGNEKSDAELLTIHQIEFHSVYSKIGM